MPCYSPLKAYRSAPREPGGKLGIVFNPHKGYHDMPVSLPCGQCIGCRLERSRQWAIRCIHEASLHEESVFVTLTYDDDHLPLTPDGPTLVPRDFVLFMKRLRKLKGSGVRFFHCGEYGDQTFRPHYHALLFNCDFSDKYLWRKDRDYPLYRSETLERLWTFGASSIGAVTFESAAYTARYIVKKITGDAATGFYGLRKPPYTTMSRRPGIAAGWFDRYRDDVLKADSVVVRGREMRPPKYYDRIREQLSGPPLSNEFAAILTHELETRGYKGVRMRRAAKYAADNTKDRLRVRETVKKAQIKSLKRNLD